MVITGPIVSPEDDDNVIMYWTESLHGPVIGDQLAVTFKQLSVAIKLVTAGIPVKKFQGQIQCMYMHCVH